MFTGIIQKVSKISSIVAKEDTLEISLDLEELAAELKEGGSVAVNGVCLTATKIDGTIVRFDVIRTTLESTNLRYLKAGEEVNIELPLKATDRLDGHIVLGHIDTTCRIRSIRQNGKEKLITFQPDNLEYIRYILPKGSVAIDGISLTVQAVDENSFTIAFIPETLKRTTIKYKTLSSIVNLETDIIIKAVVNQLSRIYPRPDKDDALKRLLKKTGFADKIE